MSEQVEQSIIRPEILAAKMAAVRNFQAPRVSAQLKTHPRLFELLQFLRAMSLRPGGLYKFVQDFLGQFAGGVGSALMISSPKTKAPYPKKIRDAIIQEIGSINWWDFLEHQEWTGANFWTEIEYADFLDTKRPDPASERQRVAFLASLNFEGFHRICVAEAAVDLARHLARACNETESPVEAPWYFSNLLDALFQMMDAHAARELATVAETAISLKIKDGVIYAGEENGLVFIMGDPRTGKSTIIKMLCAAWPGRFVLVSVPPSATLADLIRAFADALGLDYTFKTSARELQARVEYVIKNCGLAFCLDESHWMFPAHFSANTPPARLNWLRSRLIDQGCPVVLVATPQEFERCKNKYVKATSHRIEQFMGRKMLEIILPSELDENDLLAVAKIHFPDLDDDFLQVIVGSAMRSEGYLMTVEALAKRVRYIARRDGHKTVTLADLKLAMSEIMPAPPAPPKLVTEKQTAPQPLAVRRPRQRRNVPAATALEIPAGRNRPAASHHGRAAGPAGSRSIVPSVTPLTAELSAPARSITPATSRQSQATAETQLEHV